MLEGDINNKTSIYKTGSVVRIETPPNLTPKKKKRAGGEDPFELGREEM